MDPALTMMGGQGRHAAFKELLLRLAEQHEADVTAARSTTLKPAIQHPQSQERLPAGQHCEFPEQDAVATPVEVPQGSVCETLDTATVSQTVQHAKPYTEPENLPRPTELGNLDDFNLGEQKRGSRTTFQNQLAAAHHALSSLGGKRKNSEKEEVQLSGLRKLIQSPIFDRTSAALLTANAVFIGVQVEMMFEPQTPVGMQECDYAFCVCFLMELVLRLWGYGLRDFWCHPEDYAWNAFDFIVVMLSTMDAVITAVFKGEESPLGNISALRVIRIVRIVRVLRIIRVMKFFQDLRVLLAAIVSTLKTATFALILIMLIMYMFGIAITQLVGEYVIDMSAAQSSVKPELLTYFGSIGWSILTMFMTITGGLDWENAMFPLLDVGVHAVACFIVYVGLMCLCVMNVLLGIFCQCALDTAAIDKENVIELQMKDKERFVKTLEDLFDGWDVSGDGMCSYDEFQSHIHDEKTQALLRSLQIESVDALTLFGLLDSDGSGRIDLTEFVTGCISLRGGAKAVHMEKLNSMNKAIAKQLQTIVGKLDHFAASAGQNRLATAQQVVARDGARLVEAI
eukprot:TRINITY_DN10449_c0_g6_i1.p1 TRINITY_DN10449_c0_g6~~TRINITY_DN10449_c0_g6_i1.p1  ORF type:complete len:569 (-),score=95.21 TRINITY_DN10449_c0_g6_i1:188-1894(-)